ncbi:MAG: MOP flippase family protein [Melioribacteraceae bacterium]|nr:MOP flippase family protein [Melioribacteraceae bacterium]
MSLNKIAFKGIKWSTSARIIKQSLQFITILILGRLLSLEDFGLMSTAMIYVGFLQIIKDLGISSALIQIDEINLKLFSSVFWVNIVFGIILSLIIITTSPYVAIFYNEERLTMILSVLAMNFVISSFSNGHQALLERKFLFDKTAKIEIIASIFGACVGISMAILKYGVWSLVFQTLTVTIVNTFLLWVNSSLKPKFMFSIDEVKKVAKFSINLSGFNIVNYFVRNADYFLISRFLGMEALGIYSYAYRIMLYPIQNITQIISRVMFPVYSKIKNDNKKFREMFTVVANSIALITFPMMLGLMAIADYVPIVIGEKWTPIVNVLLILSPLGLVQSIYTTSGAIFQAKGKTDVWFKWGIFTALIFITGFSIGLKWGIIGVASAYLICNILVLYHGFKIPFKYIDYKITDFLKSFAGTFFTSITMYVIVYSSKVFVFQKLNLNNVISLVSLFAIGTISYIALSLLMNKDKIESLLKKMREARS